LPGRFQLLKTEKPLVLLDNASNLDAFNNLFLGIRLVNYTHQLKGLVLIVAADNDQLFDTEFLRAARYFFKKTSGQVIFCPSQKSSLELKNKGGHFDAERISNEIRSFKVKAKSAKNLADAYNQALKAVDAQNGLIVIAGSTSVVQEFNKLAEQK
jgi:folylpolyglutamate synthase/dihydropteroate synthase